MVFFDYDKEKDNTNEVMPKGVYRVMVDDIVTKPTKNGEGHCAHIQLLVLDAPFKGKKLKDFITYEHIKEQARKIGRAKLKTLLTAVGHTKALATEGDLVSAVLKKSCYIAVDVKESPDFGEQNVVKKYSSSAAATSQPQGRPQPQTNTDSVPF